MPPKGGPANRATVPYYGDTAITRTLAVSTQSHPKRPATGQCRNTPMSLAVDTELAPFGWYPDPAGSGMLRWWNGRQWTDHLEYPRPEIQPAAGYTTAAPLSHISF
jgi:hypothetical protein